MIETNDRVRFAFFNLAWLVFAVSMAVFFSSLSYTAGYTAADDRFRNAVLNCWTEDSVKLWNGDERDE